MLREQEAGARTEEVCRRHGISTGGRELLKPYPSERLEGLPVSTRVNSPDNDDPECIAPLVEPEPEARLL